MSTFKVSLEKIVAVIPHPNADRLEIVQILDWNCVTSKGNFKPGDIAVYFPVNSILPSNIEEKMFGKDSKVKLNNSRIKTIKLRGAISQGLVAKRTLFPEHNNFSIYSIGEDLSSLLNITKNQPPVKAPAGTSKNVISVKKGNSHFKKYGGIENAKNYPDLFKEGEQVQVTEKCHGSNTRAGWVPFEATTLWKKILQWLRLAPKYEFVYGSNNVQLQDKFLYTGYFDTNVYAEAVQKYKLKEILQPGEVIYGEIYGTGIQKGYLYDCEEQERRTVFFDVKKDDKWLSPVEFKHWTKERGLPIVPQLYIGPFNKEKILDLRNGPSVLAPSQKIREGIVVKSLEETRCHIGRKMLKFISDEYLLKNQDNEETFD